MQFIVTRHGSNSANQSMTPSAIVGTVEAETKQEAKSAAEAGFNCYNNQFLSVAPSKDASEGDCQEALERDTARQEDTESFTD